MAIEKLNFDKITKENIPYSFVNNNVVQKIRNLEAGFLWVYLLTLPPSWGINKTHLQKNFGIGIKKLKELLAYLKRHNLIEYIQEKDKSNKFGTLTINVLCGDKFIEQLQEKNTTLISGGTETDPTVKTASTLSVPPVLGSNGKDTHIYNNILNNEDNNNILIKRGPTNVVPPPSDKDLSTRKKTISPHWKPTPEHRALADSLELDVCLEAAKFEDYCHANGKKFISWNAAFRNWLRKAVEFKASFSYSSGNYPASWNNNEVTDDFFTE